MSETLPPIQESIYVDRPIEGVWRTLTDDALVPQWLGCLRYQRVVGHVFYMQQDQDKAARGDVSGATHCEILALDAPSLFKFSWFVPGFPTTNVSFRLEALGAERTQVWFEHDGWEQFPAAAMGPIRDMLAGGWKSHVLPNLRRAAEA